MTKLARVISIFISILFFLFVAKDFSFAEYLIQPIPDNIEHKTYNIRQIDESISYTPSITFGDLLSIPQPTTHNLQPENLSAKSASIKELLDRLENSSYESKKELAEFTKRISTTNYQLPTTNSPTPYIPIPTLIAGVNEIVSNNPQVLGEQAIKTPRGWQAEALAQAMTLARRVEEPKPTTEIGNLNQNPVKTTYTIAVLGDSMVDTLGRDLYHLRTLLQGVFPSYAFALLNYGQGATDLSSGLYRLTNTTTYLGETFAPLLSFRPDILVVESFAYNHWSAQFYDLDRQWLTIAKIIDTVRENSPDTKIVLAATIAPNSDIFGDGSLNWPESLKWESSQVIKAYLQNLVNFATSENYPLADAYHPSLGSDGKGIRKYINGGDNLHPSGEGGWLFAQKIVEAIKENELIK